MAISVGIDLGTTYSVVAYIDPVTKQPKIIPNSEGRKITPSVIQFINSSPVFGVEAESAFDAGEPNCVATFKRSMGKDETYCIIDEKPYTAVELSAILLRHLKEDAEAELGDSIIEAVITVPAYFYSLEREATIRAAKAAGLKVKKIIDEPNAAAMTYGLSHWRENANILVYDLGGGTFDVTLTRMGNDGELTTITTKGDHYLGGRDWDSRIEDLLHQKLLDETGIETRDNAETITLIRGLAEGIKKQISSMETVKVNTQLPEYGRVTVSIMRTEFNENTRDLIERTGDLCRAVLEEVGLTKKDLTDILLVGGSTRMPQVKQYLTELFDKKPIAHVNPDEAVALGAAIQSSKNNDSYTKLSIIEQNGVKTTDRQGISGRFTSVVKPEKKLTSVGLLKLQENTAHAMGIIAMNEDGTHYINDIIIPANHPRPVRAAKAFTHRTRAQDNNEMEIFVLQGSDESPLDNQIPYRFVVSDIRHIPSQRGRTLVRVQYSYDQNGVIHVQARQEQDNVDLPIRKEPVPYDMSIYGLPITQEIASTSSRSIGVYSQWAGVNRIPQASTDKYGNAVGDEYDLVEDGTFENEIIYILNLNCAFDLNFPRAALIKKGFQFIEDRTYPPADKLIVNLKTASQLWIISNSQRFLDQSHLAVIEEFFNQGHGIYVWGDNEPLYADANFVLQHLLGITMYGNSYGMQVISLYEEGKLGGIVPNHLISTGIKNMFEGDTIAEVQTNNMVLPLVYGSDGKVVTAYFDHDNKRALADGGFTRLWCNWDSAGTDRYIVNAAAWLVNLERFAEKLPNGKGTEVTDTENVANREVDTWDD